MSQDETAANYERYSRSTNTATCIDHTPPCRVVDMDVSRGSVSVRNLKARDQAPKEFTFDAIYDWK